jgi:hypothetical protein
MKKLITSDAATIITCILFSSCMSNMSITKRHYTKGYYIEYANNEPTKVISGKETKAVTAKPVVTASVVQSAPAKRTFVAFTGSKPTHAIIVNNTRKAERSVIAQGNTILSAQPKTEMTDMSTEQNSYSPSSMLAISDDSPHREGLSLFWLVILIVVILWALGVLVGLGSIIYLLLLLAVILLILWLLRII